MIGRGSMRMLVYVVLAVLVWHYVQSKRGAVSGPPHMPKAGPGTREQGGMAYAT